MRSEVRSDELKLLYSDSLTPIFMQLAALVARRSTSRVMRLVTPVEAGRVALKLVERYLSDLSSSLQFARLPRAPSTCQFGTAYLLELMERPPPSGSEGNPSISVESEVPLIAEKPFITYVEDGGKFNLVVPGVESDTSGVAKPMKNATVVPFESVYVTDPSDTAAIINAKLAEGLHIVVTPGVYELEDSLEIKQENQVVR